MSGNKPGRPRKYKTKEEAHEAEMQQQRNRRGTQQKQNRPGRPKKNTLGASNGEANYAPEESKDNRTHSVLTSTTPTIIYVNDNTEVIKLFDKKLMDIKKHLRKFAEQYDVKIQYELDEINEKIWALDDNTIHDLNQEIHDIWEKLEELENSDDESS
jgi:hypothetical protein